MSQDKLLRALGEKDEIMSIIRDSGVQLGEELFYRCLYNFQIAHWRYYKQKRKSDIELIADGLFYATDRVAEYIQRCEIERIK